jgi:hypothetical protein
MQMQMLRGHPPQGEQRLLRTLLASTLEELGWPIAVRPAIFVLNASDQLSAQCSVRLCVFEGWFLAASLHHTGVPMTMENTDYDTITSLSTTQVRKLKVRE